MVTLTVGFWGPALWHKMFGSSDQARMSIELLPLNVDDVEQKYDSSLTEAGDSISNSSIPDHAPTTRVRRGEWNPDPSASVRRGSSGFHVRLPDSPAHRTPTPFSPRMSTVAGHTTRGILSKA